jgi:hypothetical protein
MPISPGPVGSRSPFPVLVTDPASLTGGAPAGVPIFVPFLVAGVFVFNVPAGVMAIDILAVGGGSGGFNGGINAGGGAGGGGVDQQFGVPVVPLEALQVTVATSGVGGFFPVGGGNSEVRRVVPVTIMATGFGSGTPGDSPFAGDSGPPTMNAGGFVLGGGGGGGGAAGVGQSAPKGTGGPGLDVSAFWTTTWGQAGIFGGGGGGGDFLVPGHGANGVGHGANAGGGGFSDFSGSANGDLGIVVIRYIAP